MREATARRRSRWLACAAGTLALVGCGEREADRPSAPASADPGPVHVHGLGVNPADGALFVATHTGLFRAPRGELRARRVGDLAQDTMGFAVVGRDRFLGSGHPDLRERQPPFLGLIESRDAGRTWRSVSLLGKVDFHVLEARGRRIYGFGSDFGSRTSRFVMSGDGGRSWRRLRPPQPLVSLAISPRSARELVASGTGRVFRSRNGGASWSALDAPGPGLLAWTRRGLFLVDATGRVWRGISASGRWRPAGAVGGEPAAFDTGPDGSLLAALHDGRIMLSTDDGRSWTVRSRP